MQMIKGALLLNRILTHKYTKMTQQPKAVCQSSRTRTHAAGQRSELLEEPEVSQFDKESLHINCFITSHLSEAVRCVGVCACRCVFVCVQGGGLYISAFNVCVYLCAHVCVSLFLSP